MKAKVNKPGLEKLVLVGETYVHSFFKEGDIMDGPDCWVHVELGNCVPADEECEQIIAGRKLKREAIAKKQADDAKRKLKELMDAGGITPSLS